MNLLADLHTHSISSGHAYSTLRENIEEAKRKNLKFYGISDHTKAMAGAPGDEYFYNMKVLKRDYGNITLLRGAEANILDYTGTIDLTKKLSIAPLDYIIASLHIPCIDPGTREENTAAVIGAMDNEKVRIIGHPDDARYPLDLEAVVKAAMDKNVLLELNSKSLSSESSRKDAKGNMVIMMDLLKKEGYPLIIGSDAHVDYYVGDFDNAIKLIEETNFPKELVINFDEDEKRLFQFLKIDL
ncbi:MAG: phosphatase [Peptoniphilus sp.]|nr:phosphatase [Peptoniphilus sp.]